MIIEVADIRIQPNSGPRFDIAIIEGVETVISKVPGFLGYKVHKGVESPDRYLLMIFWESLDSHMRFRESPSFQSWRSIVGHFFSASPFMEHFTLLGESS